MTGKKLEPKFGLDMPFNEALRRFIQAKPKEVEKSIERSKQAKKPKRKKPPGRKRPSGNKRKA
jgi:hypothetical protein